MTTPHEYYDKDYGEWNLHSYHNSRLYEDPDMDYIASEADDQLPLLSTIGAGPRGAGIYPVIEQDEDTGHYVIHFRSDVTNEDVAVTPDLDPGRPRITFSDPKTWHENQDGLMHFSWYRGGKEAYSKDIPLPHGAHGSRIYISKDVKDYNEEQVYSEPTCDLYIYGLQKWENKPAPRPNDIVIFPLHKDNSYLVGFGTIEATKRKADIRTSDDKTYWTCRTAVGFPVPTVNEEDGHWHIDVAGQDTDMGVEAQGPQGDPGPQGLPGKQGIPGEPGETGKPGLDAAISVRDVSTLLNGEDAYVHSTKDCCEPNHYFLDFGIPRGPQGIQGPPLNFIGDPIPKEELPKWTDSKLGDAYVVDNRDGTYDAYIRGKNKVSKDQPWVIWKGYIPAVVTVPEVEYMLNELGIL